MNERTRDVIIGGLLGIIAVCAILFRLAQAGYSMEASAEAIIDFAGLAVSVLLFYTIIREKVPSPFFRKNIEDKMHKWQTSSFGLITSSQEVNVNKVIEEDKDISKNAKSFIRYYMACDFEKFMELGPEYDGRPGEFIRIPLFDPSNYKNGITIKFYLNQSTFQSRLEAKNKFADKVFVKDFIKGVATNIVLKVTNVYAAYIDTHSISPVDNSPKYEITLKLKGNFTKNSNIDILIDIINYVMLLYSYAA
jgi:hypothetical protein